MILHLLKKSALLALLAIACSAASAADRSVMLGNSRLAIPIADGHTDTTDTPHGWKLGTASIESESLLLAMQVRSDDASSYFLIKTPKDMVGTTVTKAEFLGIANRMRSSRVKLEKYSDVANRQAQENKKLLEDATSTKFDNVRFGEPMMVGPGREDDLATGYTAAWKVSAEAQGRKGSLVTLMCTHVVLAQGKLIFIQMHSPLRTEADTQRVQTECRRYVDRFIAANSQR